MYQNRVVPRQATQTPNSPCTYSALISLAYHLRLFNITSRREYTIINLLIHPFFFWNNLMRTLSNLKKGWKIKKESYPLTDSKIKILQNNYHNNHNTNQNNNNNNKQWTYNEHFLLSSLRWFSPFLDEPYICYFFSFPLNLFPLNSSFLYKPTKLWNR